MSHKKQEDTLHNGSHLFGTWSWIDANCHCQETEFIIKVIELLM